MNAYDTLVYIAKNCPMNYRKLQEGIAEWYKDAGYLTLRQFLAVKSAASRLGVQIPPDLKVEEEESSDTRSDPREVLRNLLIEVRRALDQAIDRL